nr:hypothetical protein [Clostridia bacterium]
MRQKVISMLIAIVMVIGMLPVSVSADGDISVYDGTNTYNFSSITEAVTIANSLTGNVVITLPSGEYSDNITLEQKAGLNITLSGAGDTTVYSGTITVDGNNGVNGYNGSTATEKVIIEKIKFQAPDENSHDFIWQDVAVNYPHNITVQNCTFIGNNSENVVAIRIRQGYNTVIKDCNASKLHSFLWTTGAERVTIENLTITDSGSGIHFGTTKNCSISDSTISVDQHAVRVDASVADNVTQIEDCTFTAQNPVLLRYASANHKLEVTGDNTMTATGDNGW